MRAIGRLKTQKLRSGSNWVLAHRARHFDPRPRSSRPRPASPSVGELGRDRRSARGAAAAIDEAVEGLRASGQNDYVARGLLARAAFRRAVGDWDGAARDLDEAQEIAEPGPMRLYLCDIALERARLALARREAFAPLNGLVEPSPPPPALPDAAAAAALQEEARKELDIARKLIADAATTGATKNLASSTTSSPAAAASPICRRACKRPPLRPFVMAGLVRAIHAAPLRLEAPTT